MPIKAIQTAIKTVAFEDNPEKHQAPKTPAALSIKNTENPAGKINEQRMQAASFKAVLSAKIVAPVAEGKLETAYDGMYIGAHGRAYPAGTPLDRIPAVMPAKGATMHRIIYVNGITTDKPTQFDNIKVIAETTGAPIIGIHNSTEGALKDVLQCGRDKLDLGKNAAHDTLTGTILSELRQGRSVHIIAHSQGGLITARSLRWVETQLYKQEIAKRGSLLNPFIKKEAQAETARLMGKIQVETFGAASGAYPDGPRYVHYINDADNVPSRFGLGNRSDTYDNWRAGKNAVIRHFNATFPNLSPFHKFLAPHSIDNCYMSYRVPFAQAWREGSGFMNSPVRPFLRPGYQINEAQ